MVFSIKDQFVSSTADDNSPNAVLLGLVKTFLFILVSKFLHLCSIVGIVKPSNMNFSCLTMHIPRSLCSARDCNPPTFTFDAFLFKFFGYAYPYITMLYKEPYSTNLC